MPGTSGEPRVSVTAESEQPRTALSTHLTSAANPAYRSGLMMVLSAKIAIVVGWVALILFVARVFLPSPLPVSYPETRNIFMMFPEGWGYFTRNPREPVLQLYCMDGQHEPVLVPNFSRRFLFGMRRDGRKVGGEVDLVLSQVPAKAWSVTRKRLTFEGSSADSIVIAHNTTESPTLCGDYLIQIQDRLPWAWAKSQDSVIMPSKVVHVRIVCE